jgi:hypothetical protein
VKKIPTVFRRDPDDMRRVLPEITPGCEWVLAGEGRATRKYDGTCCMFDGARWWARREVKPPKTPPSHFATVDHDPVTGKTVGWVPMESSSFARWHAEALRNLEEADDDICAMATGTYELCGPKVQGDPEGFRIHTLVRHSAAETILLLDGEPLTFDRIRDEVVRQHVAWGIEGIVWHHPDGRMAKLKARDFPQEAR